MARIVTGRNGRGKLRGSKGNLLTQVDDYFTHEMIDETGLVLDKEGLSETSFKPSSPLAKASKPTSKKK